MENLFNSNMEYRQYLTNYATSIIEYNQILSDKNCNNTLIKTKNIYMNYSPITYDSIENYRIIYDNNSDLKSNYLNKIINYFNISNNNIRY